MPKATWKTMTLILVMSMVMSAIVALPLNTMGATTDNDTQSITWYVNGTTIRPSPASGIAGITVTLKNTTVDLTQDTDANGKFTFAPVDGRGYFNLTFESDAWRHDPEPVAWGDFNDTTHVAIIDVIMTEREKITGTVEDQDTKAGIPNVNITITDKSDHDVWYAMTGPDGSFSKYLDAAGSNVELVFIKDGYYGNSTLESITLSQKKDIGTLYMEKITPTPDVKVRGWVDNTSVMLENVLVEVSEDGERWIGNNTDDTGYYEFMSFPGRLMIRATEDDHETFEDWIDVSQDGDVNYDITMIPLPTRNLHLFCRVNDTDDVIPAASVTIHDEAGIYSYDSTTNITGNSTIDYYNGNFTIVVSKSGYFTDTSEKIVWAAVPVLAKYINVTLEKINPDYLLQGTVRDSETGGPIVGASVNIYNNTKLYEAQVTTESNGHFELNTFNGDFLIQVNVNGYQSKLISSGDLVAPQNEISLDVSESKDTTRTEFRFNDWTNISVTVNRTIYIDNVTARANADRDWGMGTLGITPNNWNLNDTEITAWTNHLVDKGLDRKDTSEFLTVDDHYYELNKTIPFEVTIEGASGDITSSTSMIYINKSYNYNLVGILEDETASMYSLVLNATYDSSTEDYMYDIIVPLNPTQYEMTANVTETISVDVSGYNEPISVNPEEFAGEDTETVTMTIERSMNGTAKAKVTDGLHYVLNNTFDNYTVIVRMGSTAGVNTTVAFSAMDSTDQIGDIFKANFTWDFGDGNTGYGIEVTHNFTTLGQKTVSLTVNETGGNVTYREITIKVDSQDPKAGISVDTSDEVNVTLTGTTLTVNEDLALTFSGIKFTDAEGVTSGGIASGDDLAAGDEEGIIEKWYWSWGEEGVSNETITKEGSNNITHTYAFPGTYTLLMNVTDVVDHVSTDATWTVKVLDTTPPEPNFEMTNSTGATAVEATENETYTFNASLTRDNFEELDNMSFQWDFDSDGTIDATGLIADHMFQVVGDANVTLIANDTAGNEKNYTRLVYVSIGQRPDILMKYGSMVFGSEAGRVGKALTISVNLTNTGTVNATDITVTFYIRNADGGDTTIGTVSNALLAVDGNYTATVTWTPSKKGEYSIWAEASCAGEHSSQQWDNKIDDFDVQKISVNEAGWVVPAIIAVVLVVIVAVFFGMRYFMNTRMAAEDKSGKRKKK